MARWPVETYTNERLMRDAVHAGNTNGFRDACRDEVLRRLSVIPFSMEPGAVNRIGPEPENESVRAVLKLYNEAYQHETLANERLVRARNNYTEARNRTRGLVRDLKKLGHRPRKPKESQT